MAAKWNEFLQCARVRAAEEVDSKSRFWSPEEIRDINEKALPFAPKNPEPYLRRRAELMLATAKSAETLNQLEPFHVPSWVKILGWGAAFFLGIAVSFLGHDREINLLALPILFIIAWNFGVIIVSLFFGKKVTFFQELLRSFFKEKKASHLPRVDEGGDLGFLKKLHHHFKEIVRPVSEKRFYHKCKHWLHLAAALLALGTITGMYVNGWSRDYRAVWESSILSSSGTQIFLGSLFYPASKVVGLEIPLEAIPAMQRTATTPAPQPTSALPWIHLYAWTMFLLIVLPRLGMVAWEWWAGLRAMQGCYQEQGWKQYMDQLFAGIDGNGGPAMVLLYSVWASEDFEKRVRAAVKERWPDVGGVNFIHIAPGEDFKSDLYQITLTKRMVVIFSLAQTPEEEVHRVWLSGLIEELDKTFDFYTLAVGVEVARLMKNWGYHAYGREKVLARHQNWEQVLAGMKFEWLKVDPIL